MRLGLSVLLAGPLLALAFMVLPRTFDEGRKARRGMEVGLAIEGNQRSLALTSLLFAIFFVGGPAVGYGIARDIQAILAHRQKALNDRSRALRDLEKASEQLLAILESARDPVIVVTRDGTIVQTNASARERFNPLDETGRLQDILHPLPDQELDPETWLPEDLFELCDRGPCELKGILHDGSEIWASTTVSRAGPEDEPFYTAIIRDQTQVHELVDAVQARSADLEASNRSLEVTSARKDRALGIAAHDLRAPLSAILGYCDLLSDPARGTLSEDQESYLQRIRIRSQQMFEFVKVVLNLSRIESGDLQLRRSFVDPRDILEDVLETLEPVAVRKSIGLSGALKADLTPIYADRGLLEHVFTNLVSNAIKYSHAESTVRIEGHVHDRLVLFRVVDQGVGIPAADLEKLFHPFVLTTVVATAGEPSTGLGLYVCKRIVDSHRGRIWVGSRPGVGSVFSFCLPRDAREQPTPEELQRIIDLWTPGDLEYHEPGPSQGDPVSPNSTSVT